MCYISPGYDGVTGTSYLTIIIIIIIINANILIIIMEDHRVPKTLLSGQQEKGKRSVGRPRLRYKDTLKYNLKECGICPDAWEKTAQERIRWRGVYNEGVSTFEKKRTTNLKDRRMKQKAESAFLATICLHVCAMCNRVFRSRIGLISHGRSHRS